MPNPVYFIGFWVFFRKKPNLISFRICMSYQLVDSCDFLCRFECFKNLAIIKYFIKNETKKKQKQNWIKVGVSVSSVLARFLEWVYPKNPPNVSTMSINQINQLVGQSRNIAFTLQSASLPTSKIVTGTEIFTR